jgi:pimeloyl-ACP methyl ester carboxylesterase
MMDTRHGFAEVNDTRLHYEVAGRGDPLVLIHGFTLDMRMWDDQFASFAEHHRVVRYDVRGFGTSAVPAGAPSTNADDLAALLGYLNIPSAAIIGLSMGGGIAIDFALAHPAMTHTLIPVDSSLSGHQWSDEWNVRFGHIGQTARTAGVDAAKAEWLADPLFAPANERAAVAARLQRMVADYSGWHWENHSPERKYDPPASARIGEITAPTLVVIGERDLPDFHVVADRITAQAPNAHKIVIPGVGHMANMEAPEQFNAAVLDFLATT